MARPVGSKNKRTHDMVEYSEAEGRLAPAKAMVAYYMMDLEAFPKAKAAFPGMVNVKLARRLKALKTELGVDVFEKYVNIDELRAMVEYEVLQDLFPSMPRVVAMKEAAPYCHSKMPAMVQLDVSDNRVAERIMAGIARMQHQPIAKEPPRDVTPSKPGGIASIISGRAGS